MSERPSDSTSAGPQTLYAWFTQAAAQFAEHTALEVGGEKLTYGRLQELAERLAARLIAAHGGDQPRRIGLLTGRSVTTYAGYLAVLRTGATVVPLNKEFPTQRNAAMAAAAELDLIITDDPEDDGGELKAPLLVVGPAELAGLEPPGALPPCPAAPEDIAYIIFTSGSTGTPKGVPVLHRNISAYLSHVVPRYDVGPGSRLSQSSDLTFDVSVYDMFVAWSSGGTLVVPTKSQLSSPVKFINAQQLTHWFSVPSLASFASRLGTLKPDSMPSLRWSVFAGEPLPLGLALEWQAAAPNTFVENLYGPTELTITCIEYVLPRDPEQRPTSSNGTVPMGSCYSQLEYVLLDENGVAGSEGELCVRGPQRFPGYLDPANNAGRFLTRDADGTVHRIGAGEPLTEEHWYCTGDRVGLQHGQLVHLGRVDHQVKIRGYRIEPGEIEAVLRAQPGVRDAIVLSVQGREGHNDLEAAVCGTSCDPARLTTALKDRLPAYMVPRRITVVEEFPLNAHGKIDRRTLAAALGGGDTD